MQDSSPGFTLSDTVDRIN